MTDAEQLARIERNIRLFGRPNARESEWLLAQLQAAQGRIAALEGVLADLVDPVACELDDSGSFCIEHGIDMPCPDGRGQELLSKEALLKGGPE
jgi:hypothetical protein